MLIEIAVFSLESAIAACQAGAHRIELCSAPAEGGLTPSEATMQLARKYVNIPIHVMIRPREGDFCYSETEFEAMMLDIATAKRIGLDGVVAGILNADGAVDKDRTAMLVAAARPMNVTFHRAFDMVSDQHKALEDIIATGCQRILTSGGRQKAPEGSPKLAKLVKQAAGRITIMPGSGINSSNIKQLAELTGAQEMHLSARTFIKGKMEFRQLKVTMGGTVTIPDFEIQTPDEKAIREILNIFS